MVAVGADAVQLYWDCRVRRRWACELLRFAGIGGGTTTVTAHVSPRTDRVDRFVLFIGGAGD